MSMYAGPPITLEEFIRSRKNPKGVARVTNTPDEERPDYAAFLFFFMLGLLVGMFLMAMTPLI